MRKWPNNITNFFRVKQYLPPATKLGQGYVFTRVCDSVHRGVGWGWYASMHCRWYLSMPCSRSAGGGRVASQHALKVVSQHALQVSGGVSRPTLGGGGSPDPHPVGLCIPACTEADPPMVYLPGGVPAWGGVPAQGVYLWGCTCLSACWDTHTPGQIPPWVDTHPGQTYIPLGRNSPPPPGGHCSGRYASYWNAFLFYMRLSISLLIVG